MTRQKTKTGRERPRLAGLRPGQTPVRALESLPASFCRA